MKKLISALLFFALLSPFPAAAQQVAAIIVTACGTPPFTYTAGQVQPIVQDVNGNLCNGSGSGGSGTKIISGTGTYSQITITAGGVDQTLAAPTNGFEVINPDASEDCWLSEGTAAVANSGTRLAANGGGYTSPAFYGPGIPHVLCATISHKLTYRRW